MLSYQIVEHGASICAKETMAPTPTGSEVLLRVDACGVCHTDLHIWDGYFDLGGGERLTMAQRGLKLPFTMGHEIVGRVESCGPEAPSALIGRKKLVFPWIGCGSCWACDSGQEQLCSSPRHIGTRVAGGYSDYVLVPHAKYLLDYDGIAPELACTYACSGLTAYSALKKLTDLRQHDNLVVIGAGGLGLAAIQLANSLLRCRVIAVDVNPAKRAAALTAGAGAAFDSSASGATEILEATRGGAAAAIDFVGAPATTRFGIDVLRKGGTHIVVGLYGDQLTLPLPYLPWRMLTLRGSYVGSLGELQELIALAKQGKVQLHTPLTVRQMSEVNDALADLRAGRVVGRAVLTPDSGVRETQ